MPTNRLAVVSYHAHAPRNHGTDFSKATEIRQKIRSAAIFRFSLMLQSGNFVHPKNRSRPQKNEKFQAAIISKTNAKQVIVLRSYLVEFVRVFRAFRGLSMILG